MLLQLLFATILQNVYNSRSVCVKEHFEKNENDERDMITMVMKGLQDGIQQ